MTEEPIILRRGDALEVWIGVEAAHAFLQLMFDEHHILGPLDEIGRAHGIMWEQLWDDLPPAPGDPS